MSKQSAPLGLSAAAREACVAENTLRRLADAGVVACTRDSAGRRLFDRRDIAELKRTTALKALNRASSQYAKKARKVSAGGAR